LPEVPTGAPLPAAQRAPVAPTRLLRRPVVLGIAVYVRTLAAFALLWAAVALWTANPVLLPSPRAVAAAFVELAADGELFSHAGVSLGRMIVALAIAGGLAIPLGLLMGLSRALEAFVDPVVEVLRPISGIAWIPLALFIFGVGHALPLFIMTYAAFFPILLGTVAGVRGVDRNFLAVARTMGVGRREIVVHVVVPAALPALMVALRLGVAAAWTAVVAAELIGAPSGVGYAVEWYRELLMTPQVMSFIAVIGLLGYACDQGVRWLGRRATPWAADGRVAA